MTIQKKATELYFPVVLVIMLYKVFLTFESVDNIFSCVRSRALYEAGYLLMVSTLNKRMHGLFFLGCELLRRRV